MHAAVSLSDIETSVSEGNYPKTQRSILLIFSAFNETEDGENREFLTKINDYHFHSAENTACYCIGYSAYEPKPSKEFGPSINLKKLGQGISPLSYFYPKKFHEIRSDIQKSLNQKWQYQGGVDLLLFSVSSDREVLWQRAAVASSNKLVRDLKIFHSADEMIKTILNMNEASGGTLVPDQLQPEIAQKIFWTQLKALASRFGGDILSSALGLVGK